MSTTTLPSPSRLRDELRDKLPGIARGGGNVTVTTRYGDGRRSSSAWAADCYEIAAFYIDMGTPLDELEAALQAWPGVVRTTQVTGFPAQVRDEDWPGFRRRRDRRILRPQVLALIADETTGGTS